MPNENSWLKNKSDLFECCELLMLDEACQKSRIDEAIEFIEKVLFSDKNNKVYVRYYVGSSRLASIVIGYLINKAKTDKVDHSFDTIYNFVKGKGQLLT